MKIKKRSVTIVFTVILCFFGAHQLYAQNKKTANAPPGKPNIVVIFGDDIGFWNLSVYSRGAMGYRTPNIDRIGKEGAIFSDHYAQPSCTPGRAAFITGQLPIRSGLTTVAQSGDKLGLQPQTVTLAEVLKQQGYTTGQFGKNHLGDRNEFLPTVHGFDEFFGNLYHLNTEEEPEDVDYPTDPEFKKKHGPRGVLHTYATDKEDATVDPKFGKIGKQRIEDTGPLTRKRMETVDEEFMNATFKFMERAKAQGKPFFTWIATSRMHVFTHAPKRYYDSAKQYTSADDPHAAGMIQHDENISTILKKLEDMGISENTIVIYSSDNGPETDTYPYGGTTPYRSMKMTTWEGAVRVPMLIRWPAMIKPGTELNGIQSHEDLFTTLASAAGATDVKEQAARGDAFGTDVVKKNYIDGVNNLDYWTGKTDKSARNSFIYYSESNLQAVRVNQWKLHFFTRSGYYGTTTKMEIPILFNIRQDPFEYFEGVPGPRTVLQMQKQYVYQMVSDVVMDHIRTLKEYPPVQKGVSLSPAEVIKQIQ